MIATARPPKRAYPDPWTSPQTATLAASTPAPPSPHRRGGRHRAQPTNRLRASTVRIVGAFGPRER